MRTMRTVLAAAVLTLCFGEAHAAEPQVTVTAGQALQLKGETFGPGAVDGLTHDLARTVGAALSRGAGGPSEVRLVLQDASPSRSQASLNLGGAWIDGFVIAAFPVKVHRGSAGWTRAVAILPG